MRQVNPSIKDYDQKITEVANILFNLLVRGTLAVTVAAAVVALAAVVCVCLSRCIYLCFCVPVCPCVCLSVYLSLCL